MVIFLNTKSKVSDFTQCFTCQITNIKWLQKHLTSLQLGKLLHLYTHMYKYYYYFNKKNLIISIYRARNSDFQYLESVCFLIHDTMLKNPILIVWIGSDLNLSNIHWTNNSVSNNLFPFVLCIWISTVSYFSHQKI